MSVDRIADFLGLNDKLRYVLRWYWPLMLIAVIICALSTAAVVALTVAVEAEARAWKRFAAEHDCKVVGKMSGDIIVGIGPVVGGNGSVAVTTSYTGDKTGYLCNDGITYWR